MDPTLDTTPLSTPPIPPTGDTEFRLGPGLPRRWTAVTLLFVLPMALAGTIVAWLLGLWWVLAPAVVFGTLVPWWVHYYGRRYVATFRCVLGDPGLFVERGVWWRSQTFVPRARVQHTDVDQGPLARRFGLATLKVFTAGSAHSEIAIEDLLHGDALQMRDDLLERHDRPRS